MISIAICDNSENDIQDITQKVKTWVSMQTDTNISISESTASVDFLSLIKSGKKYQIYILDIIMPEVTGIDIAREIRKRDEDALIIYTTSSVEYAFDAFSVHALRYIKKPVSYPELESALNFAKAILENRKKTNFIVKGISTISSVVLEEVMYIENDVRNVIFTMEDGKKVTGVRRSGSFEEFLEDISGKPGFIQTHKSFFINMKYISTLKTDKVVMDDGREIPISRKHLSKVRNVYIDYASKGGVSI